MTTRGARRPSTLLLLGAVSSLLAGSAAAESGVTFHDVAAGGGAGLSYGRTPSASVTKYLSYTQLPIVSFADIIDMPFKFRGIPGVAIFDYDRDGDLDLYVTNGPGSDNSLFANQLVETEELSFVDVAVPAGVAATDQDSTGVCFGDTDNDGDEDLLVLSNFGYNRFFENDGDGTFTDLSATSALSSVSESSISCSFGDVDGDGLLDVVVGNSYLDMSTSTGILTAFAYNVPNRLYRNAGGNAFVDVSDSSGIRQLRGFPPEHGNTPPTLTWAVAMVDYDLDGDTDILQADDQAGVPRAQYGGVDRGFIHVLRNDGTGHFTDVTVESNMQRAGEWMGLSFGDVNADGYLDLFGSNSGDWANTTISPLDPIYADFFLYDLGQSTSRWFLGGPGGVFTDPGVGGLVATPFGWGTSMADYDNDADTDVVYYGGLAFGPVVHNENFGTFLRNDGQGNFTYDVAAVAGSTDHQRRLVEGLAIGDLDDDGYPDVVSVSGGNLAAVNPQSTYNVDWGSPIDDLVWYQRTFLPVMPFLFTYDTACDDFENGTLAVEINGGESRNRWVKVALVGGAGQITRGAVNRDGIGAVVRFTTARGKQAMQPVLGGSSYASQDSLELTFGLGKERRGTLEVLWPGGVRNRLYDVNRGERVTFPEIPCSFDDYTATLGHYTVCVIRALHQQRDAGVIDRGDEVRFLTSALLAYVDERL